MTSSSKVLFLSGNDVRELADWVEVVNELAEAYSGRHGTASLPPRTIARSKNGSLRTLSAAPENGSTMGAKFISMSSRTRQASYLIALFDSMSSELVCLLDAGYLTALRTAATSILAIDRLFGPGSPRVGVLGAGFEARNHLEALTALREVDDVCIFSPTPNSREQLAGDFRERGIAVRAVETAQLAVADADVVICAARSRCERPIVEASWMKPGTVLASIGSTVPEQRELGLDSIRAASVIVADMPEEVMNETGDFLAATEGGVEFRDKVCSLSEVVANPIERRTGRGIVMYKSVGSALQDITVAELLYKKATSLGLGSSLPMALDVASKGKAGTKHV